MLPNSNVRLTAQQHIAMLSLDPMEPINQIFREIKEKINQRELNELKDFDSVFAQLNQIEDAIYNKIFLAQAKRDAVEDNLSALRYQLYKEKINFISSELSRPVIESEALEKINSALTQLDIVDREINDERKKVLTPNDKTDIDFLLFNIKTQLYKKRITLISSEIEPIISELNKRKSESDLSTLDSKEVEKVIGLTIKLRDAFSGTTRNLEASFKDRYAKIFYDLSALFYAYQDEQNGKNIYDLYFLHMPSIEMMKEHMKERIGLCISEAKVRISELQKITGPDRQQEEGRKLYSAKAWRAFNLLKETARVLSDKVIFPAIEKEENRARFDLCAETWLELKAALVDPRDKPFREYCEEQYNLIKPQPMRPTATFSSSSFQQTSGTSAGGLVMQYASGPFAFAINDDSAEVNVNVDTEALDSDLFTQDRNQNDQRIEDMLATFAQQRQGSGGRAVFQFANGPFAFASTGNGNKFNLNVGRRA